MDRLRKFQENLAPKIGILYHILGHILGLGMFRANISPYPLHSPDVKWPLTSSLSVSSKAFGKILEASPHNGLSLGKHI